MAITVSVTGDSPEQLKAHLSWLADKLGATAMMTDVLAKNVETFKSDIVETVTNEIKQHQQASLPVETVQTITIKDLQSICAEKANAYGMPRVKEEISKFGVSSVKELPEDKRAELMAAIKAISS